MGRKRSPFQYKLKDFKGAIPGSRGNKALIAKRVGCDRVTLYNYLDRYPELEVLIEAEKKSHNSSMVDIARTQLHKDLLKGKQYAVSFVLKTLGRDEGFVERSELTGPDGQAPFNLVVEIPTITRDSKKKGNPEG